MGKLERVVNIAERINTVMKTKQLVFITIVSDCRPEGNGVCFFPDDPEVIHSEDCLMGFVKLLNFVHKSKRELKVRKFLTFSVQYDLLTVNWLVCELKVPKSGYFQFMDWRALVCPESEMGLKKQWGSLLSYVKSWHHNLNANADLAATGRAYNLSAYVNGIFKPNKWISFTLEPCLTRTGYNDGSYNDNWRGSFRTAFAF